MMMLSYEDSGEPYCSRDLLRGPCNELRSVGFGSDGSKDPLSSLKCDVMSKNEKCFLA